MIWTSTQKKDTKIVAIKDRIIYLFNPKESEIDNYLFDLKMGNIPQKNMFSIPFHYINTINFYENKNMFEIVFGESTEEVFISDPGKMVEIFNYLMENIPGINYYVEEYSGLKAGKKPFIAILVCIVLFIWSYGVADTYEHGDVYDATVGQTRIGGVIFLLASLGTKKLIIVFSCLVAIAGFSLYMKIKNPYQVRKLWR